MITAAAPSDNAPRALLSIFGEGYRWRNKGECDNNIVLLCQGKIQVNITYNAGLKLVPNNIYPVSYFSSIWER